MKKNLLLLLLMAGLTVSFFSCSDDDDADAYKTYEVATRLIYPSGSDFEPAADVSVTLTNQVNGDAFEAKTDSKGIATFHIPAGVYNAAVTDTRSSNGVAIIFNGSKSSITVTSSWKSDDQIQVELVASQGGNLIIKELYIGGCLKDDNSGSYYNDKYMILYNNSDVAMELGDVCLGLIDPYNGHATNNDYVNGVLEYEAKGWIPAGSGFWYFPEDVNPVLQPGEQLVIALNNAINNTTVYSNSINYENTSYYTTYDPASFTNTSQYTLPTVIPAEHYLKAFRFSLGNSWVLSQMSPAVFIFIPQGTTLDAFTNDVSTTVDPSASLTRKKVEVEWVVDGIEVFKADATNQKRLTATIDAGYVNHTSSLGYTLYRNVDKEATEAIEGNAGKLVYGYSLGTTEVVNGTTDPSGIDAEASIKNGARIIYKDTNNSSNDFHQRSRASLRN